MNRVASRGASAARRRALVVAVAAALVGTVLSPPASAAVLVGNAEVHPSTDYNPAGLAEAYRTTASASGTVQKLTVFVDSGSTASKLVAGLYSNNGTHPGSLLGQGSLDAPANGAWNDVALGSPVSVAEGTVYWVAVLGPSGAGTLRYRDNCCGGGTPAETSAQATLTSLPSAWSTGTVFMDGPVSAYGSDGSGPGPGPGPEEVGRFDGPYTWPLVPVHMELLPTGKVLVWDGFEYALNSERVWDPATGSFTQVPSGRNYFCVGQVTLADGRALLVGGHVDAYVGLTDSAIFDPSTSSWTRGKDMARARWYPTATVLPDGRVLVVSGDNISRGNAGAPGPFVNASDTLPEVYDPATNSWTQLTPAARRMPLYPFMFVLPDGRVLDAGPDTVTRTLDVATGAWTTVATSPIDGHSAVMYEPGKVLKSGTWAETDIPVADSTAGAAVIDMNQTSPAWREVTTMANARSYHTLTALPDGTVLATGGATRTDGVDPAHAVQPAEIWDPQTEAWTTVASLQVPRLYHSSALLLPDGRVVVAGGGRFGSADNHPDAEVYSPPYLFKGARPAISSAPGTVQYGSTFSVSTPDASRITWARLIHIGSVTHNFDQAQTSMALSFSQAAGGLSIRAPANPNLAPPGVYMLFIVDSNGVPSVASFVKLPVESEPPTAPTNLAATGAVGAASLSWTASTDDVAVTGYDLHRSTTAGFAVSEANRIAQVTGTSYTDSGLQAGTYHYRVTARDAAGNVSAPSNEASAVVAADTTPPTVAITDPAPGATVSGSVVVTADASDAVGVAGVQFKVDGANLGAEDTAAPYSVSWDSRTAANGSSVLTAVARDAAGNTATSSQVTVTVSNSAGLVAAYSFNQGSGTTAPDDSGNGNSGTLWNATWSASGRYGGAVSFNGSNAWVTVADADSLDLTSGMTLEAWVRPAATMGKTWRTVILKEQTGQLVYALYANNENRKPSGHLYSGGDIFANGASQVAANAWTHLAATYDGATLRLYVNGSQVKSRSFSGAMPNSAGPLRIGGNSVWGEYFNGLIDEVRIYNRALSAADIQADMNAPIAP